MVKKMAAPLLLIGVVWLAWLFLRTPQAIRADERALYVKNLPLSDRGKVNWWRENRAALQKQFPLLVRSGNTVVMIMNFDRYDRLPTGTRDGSIEDYNCFSDISAPEKCIYKEMVMLIFIYPGKKTVYSFGETSYEERPDGTLTRLHETFSVR
ncbi:DUF943 family protein [Kosakonia sp. SMBL-WEM22]|uniref:DUF943 family protein n=1 Tax=Kosakonia sp. SMBL-WEM22 TaxID=2725560 RepID=UPI0016595E00|nr:DUF943 family protein [Kosakonia sp. SMBL-WEM22]MDV5356669.1 DUF943 family protein [Enterobacter asburiae]QNQ20357.1 DUF943 family protein [Kosakonia sp. SMBL-WEM22]